MENSTASKPIALAMKTFIFVSLLAPILFSQSTKATMNPTPTPTPPSDTTPPTLNSADLIDGKTISAFFSEDLNDSALSRLDFGVKIDNDGSYITPTSATDSNGTVTLVFADSFTTARSLYLYINPSVPMSIKDTNGNEQTETIAVRVNDKIKPVITVLGTNPIDIPQGIIYNDAGATAVDILDGSVSVTSNGLVDYNAIGTYTITYTATDTSNNTSTATRTVNVIVAPFVGGCGNLCQSGYSSTPTPTPTPTPNITPTPIPEVLGETASCGELITNYLWFGNNNNSEQVKILQQFLNEQINAKLPITGYYGVLTKAAVTAFQEKYSDKILQPWINLGLLAEKKGTGNVFKTTKWWINMTSCPSLNLTQPIIP